MMMTSVRSVADRW